MQKRPIKYRAQAATALRYFTNSYYPFGMQMQGREFAGGMGYRYGFGSQESDNEVSGRGNSYTAEFWQYDSRLGRRWNVDPVNKLELSQYVAFSNNPIVRIDPLGNDDFYDSRGKYLASTGVGNNIRIVNQGITYTEAIHNLEVHTKLLHQFNFCDNQVTHRSMLKSIVNNYASGADLINGEIGIKDYGGRTVGAAAQYDPPPVDRISVLIDAYGNVNESITNYFNLTNIFVHERYHRIDPYSHSHENHFLAVIQQSNHSSWSNTEQSFKESQLSYAASTLTKALQQGLANKEQIEVKLKLIHESPLGGVGTITYDESSQRYISEVQELDRALIS